MAYGTCMTEEHQQNLEKLEKLFSKGKAFKAMKLANLLAAEYNSKGHYLMAVQVWKRVLRVDASQVEAHLRLIALQDQLKLEEDARVQRHLLQELCRESGIAEEELEQRKANLGLQTAVPLGDDDN